MKALLSFFLLCFVLIQADWNILSNAPGPIRSIVRRSDGRLLGPRLAGPAIETWGSSDEGKSWYQVGSIASDPNVQFGDPMLYRVPNTATIFAAFRQHTANNMWQLTVCRSDNDGQDWVFDSTPYGPTTPFIGAPFLFQRLNGDLQIYFDNEYTPQQQGYNGNQWITMLGRSGTGGAWTKYGLVVASREPNPATICRDGLSSVIQLGNDRIMLVTEGVDTGGSHSNVLRAIESFDGGVTWDYTQRIIIYEARVDSGSGKRYNAYDPWGIRVGNGPVRVAFCTDEDFPPPPDSSSTPVNERRSHIKYIQTTDTFEHWSGPTTIWSGSSQNYSPGLFERQLNDVIATIDTLNGNALIMVP